MSFSRVRIKMSVGVRVSLRIGLGCRLPSKELRERLGVDDIALVFFRHAVRFSKLV